LAKITVRLVDWRDVVEWARILADRIRESGYKPTIIVAVSRGGYVPARLLCDFLGVENLVSIQSQHWTEAAKMAEKALIKFKYTIDLRGHKALLVDDIVDTGDTLLLARSFIKDNWRPDELRVASLQWISTTAKFKPDYYAVEVREWAWFQYPWTRLEDVTQFIKRMLGEERPSRPLSLEEIKSMFKDRYGIEVEDFYYKYAVERLVEQGVLEERNGEYVYRGAQS
jgi:hypoxanthine phosphoribosyltransferase